MKHITTTDPKVQRADALALLQHWYLDQIRNVRRSFSQRASESQNSSLGVELDSGRCTSNPYSLLPTNVSTTMQSLRVLQKLVLLSPCLSSILVTCLA